VKALDSIWAISGEKILPSGKKKEG